MGHHAGGCPSAGQASTLCSKDQAAGELALKPLIGPRPLAPGSVRPNPLCSAHHARLGEPTARFASVQNRLIPRFKISRISWRDAALTVGPFVLLVLVVLWITLHFIRPAPLVSTIVQ